MSEIVEPQLKTWRYRLEDICTDTPLAGLLWERQMKVLIDILWAKSQHGAAYLCTVERNLSLRMCGRSKNERKEAQTETHVGHMNDTS